MPNKIARLPVGVAVGNVEMERRDHKADCSLVKELGPKEHSVRPLGEVQHQG